MTRFLFAIHGTINLPGPNNESKDAKKYLGDMIARARDFGNHDNIEEVRIYVVESD